MSERRAFGSASGPVSDEPKQRRRALVALRRRRVREAERRRGGDDHRDPVRDERVVAHVARRLPRMLEARDRIGARVRDVHARRAEADARHRRREHHRAARLDVPVDRAPQEAPAVLQRLRRPHVGDRVGALVGRPVVGGRRGVPGRVRQRQIGLGRVADDVQPGRGGDLRRHRRRQQRIDDRLRRTQPPMRDAGLHPPRRDVQHRDRGRLAPGARGGREREVRQQRPGRLHAAADRRVDVVHHRRRMRDVSARRPSRCRSSSRRRPTRTRRRQRPARSPRRPAASRVSARPAPRRTAPPRRHRTRRARDPPAGRRPATPARRRAGAAPSRRRRPRPART